MEQGDAPFLSSGTWSLLGVKLAKPITSPDSCKANFTNEGGVGYIRYLKNIMGLWIIQCVQKQLGISFAEMVELESLTGQHWDKLYIAGGGAKNATLNELTAHYTGKQVVALPIEATAIGNLKIQMQI